MVKKNRLGKGLSALLSSEIDDLDIKEESSGKNLVSINEISLSKFQARKKFNQERGRNPTFEDLMSGKGINYIYKCFNNSINSGYTNEEILVNKVDSTCLKTRKLMLYLLATYAKYIALIWGATSGVYFSGSIANSLLQPEELETFRADFENSPTMQELLVTMPVFLIKDLNLGLRGGLVLALRG